MSNSPFSKRFGHDMSVKDVRTLFVEDRMLEKKFCSKQNTLIWGFRGTGKTMLLRYFDIEVRYDEVKNFRKCINENKFIGIYLNFVRGAFDMPNLDPELDKHYQRTDIPVLYNRMAYTISEHFLISAILEKIMKKFALCADSSYETSDYQSFVTDAAKIMNITLRADDRCSNDLFEDLADKISSDRTIVANALASFSMGNKTAFDPLQSYMTFEFTFKPIIESLQKRINKNIPVYLLLDDVNNLHTFQQKQINGWIGQRVHNLVCFKLASEPLEQRAFGTLFGTGRILQKVHDYDEIYLDFDDLFRDFKTRKEIYAKIANERIRHFFKEKHQVDYQGPWRDDLLPACIEQQAELDLITNELKQIYPESKREIYRERWVELHKRGKRRYAGMDDLTILAFGNIREFLLNCDSVFSVKAFDNVNVKRVPPSEQDSYIRDLSKKLSERVSTLDSFYEEEEIDGKLEKLIINLLKLFRYRLYEANLIEKSFVSFAVRDLPSLSDVAKHVLRRGIERQFFRKANYSSKSGDRQSIFTVNKLLFPEYGLNIREAGSKLEFSASLFSQALYEEDIFITVAKTHSTASQLTLEGMFDILEIEGEITEYEFGRLY